MKGIVKSLTGVVVLLFMSVTAYGFSGDIEIGIGVNDFEESVKTKDYTEPYISYNLYPVEGSSLFIRGKSAYRDQYNKDENDKRKRHQVYVGYQWSKGNFSFEPAVGVRLESFDEGKFEERNELRFIPTMTYRFNRKLEWYFTGYIGYADVDGEESSGGNNGGNNNGGGNNKKIEYENQRVRNLITGLRYRLNNKLRLDTFVQHKKREEWSSHYYGTTYRTRLNYDLYRAKKTKLTLNGQMAYSPKVETSKQGNTEDDEFIYRAGFTLRREVTKDIEVIGKFYYQWRPQNVQGSSGERSTEHEQFYSMAVRYYF